MTPRNCPVCGDIVTHDRHIMINELNVVQEQYCDFHCPNCYKPKVPGVVPKERV